jgi:drug/metabolite transporter (DMT)-like permease
VTPLATTLTLLSAFFHAGWNLLARKYRGGNIFLRVPLLIAAVGLIPVLLAGIWSTSLPQGVWVNFTISGICLATYFLGLTQGYQSGEFSVVYPLARALPVLALALADIALGNPPTAVGWVGILLVAIGCMTSPLKSLHSIHLSTYLNRTTIWILITAAGMVGYTLADNQAADRFTPGISPVLRYHVLALTVSFVVFWVFLKLRRQPVSLEGGLESWKWPAVMAALLFTAYTLVLVAYQYSTETSYVAAVRQFSLVIAVPIGAFYFKETSPLLRILAAVTITAGIILIALGG